MTYLSIDDWDDFSPKHPVFEMLAACITTHAAEAIDYPKNWHLPGWVGNGDLVAVFGEPGGGKSMFAIDVACRLAAGQDLDGAPNGYRRNVLYIAAERGDQVRRRVSAFCHHHGGERFHNLAIYSGPIDIMQPNILRGAVYAAQRAFRDNIDAEGSDVDLVVIDTLAASMSASDSSPDAMGAAVREITRTINAAGEDQSTVMVIHHSPVSGEARMRGGGQLQGAADTVIHVTKKRGVSVARVIKNNESSARPERAFAMQTVVIGEGEDAVEAPVLIPAPDAAAAARKLAAPLLAKGHRTAIESLRAAIAAKGGPVTSDEWRAASDAAAGDITADGKRTRFRRSLGLVEAGLAVKDGDLFSLAGHDKTTTEHDNCREQ